MTRNDEAKNRSRQHRREPEGGQGRENESSVERRGGGGGNGGGEGQELEVSRGGSYAPALRYDDPFSMMQQMAAQMDQLFDSLGFGGPGFGPRALAPLSPFGQRQVARGGGSSLPGLWTPQIEVQERENELVVRADLPGIERDDVTVEVEDNRLVIHGERRQEREENERGYYRSERSYGSFHRALQLPEGIDPEEIQATFERGVLEVRMRRPREQQRGRRIEIGGGQGARGAQGGQGSQGGQGESQRAGGRQQSGRGSERTSMSAGETDEETREDGAGRSRAMRRGERS